MLSVLKIAINQIPIFLLLVIKANKADKADGQGRNFSAGDNSDNSLQPLISQIRAQLIYN